MSSSGVVSVFRLDLNSAGAGGGGGRTGNKEGLKWGCSYSGWVEVCGEVHVVTKLLYSCCHGISGTCSKS